MRLHNRSQADWLRHAENKHAYIRNTAYCQQIFNSYLHLINLVYLLRRVYMNYETARQTASRRTLYEFYSFRSSASLDLRAITRNKNCSAPE